MQSQATALQEEKAQTQQKYYNIKANYMELLKQLKEADVDVDGLEDEFNSSDDDINTIMQDREEFELEWKYFISLLFSESGDIYSWIRCFKS